MEDVETWCRWKSGFWSLVDTALFHYRSLQTHIGTSKNAPIDPHPYQTIIYIASTAPSKRKKEKKKHALIAIAVLGM